LATRAEAEAHREIIHGVETLAVADMVDAWGSIPDRPEAAEPEIRQLIDEMVDGYHPVATTIAADWYEDLRTEADVPGRYTASLAQRPPAEMTAQTASWAAGGLYVSREKALGDAAAAVQRIIGIGDRSTISLNVRRDRSGPRWARYASASACAFCAVVASRGAVYRSEDTAAGKYHKHCRCIAVPVWNPQRDYDEAPYVADWRQSYDQARSDVGGDFKAILSHMRKNAGFR
jgi:hypothetical protein